MLYFFVFRGNAWARAKLVKGAVALTSFALEVYFYQIFSTKKIEPSAPLKRPSRQKTSFLF